jgi:hypothetical protein
MQVYINGSKVKSSPIQLMSTLPVNTNLQLLLGGYGSNTMSSSSVDTASPTLEWHMGSHVLLDMAANSKMISEMYLRGPGYRGVFQGSMPVPANVSRIAMRERLHDTTDPAHFQHMLYYADQVSYSLIIDKCLLHSKFTLCIPEKINCSYIQIASVYLNHFYI